MRQVQKRFETITPGNQIAFKVSDRQFMKDLIEFCSYTYFVGKIPPKKRVVSRQIFLQKNYANPICKL